MPSQQQTWPLYRRTKLLQEHLYLACNRPPPYLEQHSTQRCIEQATLHVNALMPCPVLRHSFSC